MENTNLFNKTFSLLRISYITFNTEYPEDKTYHIRKAVSLYNKSDYKINLKRNLRNFTHSVFDENEHISDFTSLSHKMISELKSISIKTPTNCNINIFNTIFSICLSKKFNMESFEKYFIKEKPIDENFKFWQLSMSITLFQLIYQLIYCEDLDKEKIKTSNVSLNQKVTKYETILNTSEDIYINNSNIDNISSLCEDTFENLYSFFIGYTSPWQINSKNKEEKISISENEKILLHIIFITIYDYIYPYTEIPFKTKNKQFSDIKEICARLLSLHPSLLNSISEDLNCLNEALMKLDDKLNSILDKKYSERIVNQNYFEILSYKSNLIKYKKLLKIYELYHLKDLFTLETLYNPREFFDAEDIPNIKKTFKVEDLFYLDNLFNIDNLLDIED